MFDGKKSGWQKLFNPTFKIFPGVQSQIYWSLKCQLLDQNKFYQMIKVEILTNID